MAAAIPIITALATVASTAYSIYSSERAEEKAEKEEKRQRAMQAELMKKSEQSKAVDEAALAEARRIRQRRAMLRTIKTSEEGLLSPPTTLKQTLG